MERANYDLVCIGGGGAAILAAIYASAAGISVALVTKDYPGFGNTRLAVGMTACPGIMPEDSAEQFTADLLLSGEGISEPAVVNAFANEASRSIAALEKLGLLFQRSPDGSFPPARVEQIGGHSRPRSVANLGGGASLGVYLKSALWRYGVAVYNNTAALELIKTGNRVSGVLVLDLKERAFIGLKCNTVLIATGGCSALYYPHTTNSRGAAGDGLALAMKAGAVLWDMEQLQAIPFGITRPRSMVGALCGEPSTAGPAGRLLDGLGNILIDGEINKMTRAAVTRVMMSAIAAGRTDSNGGLQLDLKPNLNLPGGEKLYRAALSSGIFDIVRTAYSPEAFRWEEPWSVMPTFHYQMGGIRVNMCGETGVDGLLAAGEVQAGLHGGNRLGSVALSEIYTAGAKIGKVLGNQSSFPGLNSQGDSEIEDAFRLQLRIWQEITGGQGQHNPVSLRADLEECMWRLAGPVRDEASLLEALRIIDGISARSRNLDINPEIKFNRQVLDAVELNLMIPAARSIVLSALERRESRGAHLRADYLKRDDRKYSCHTYVRMTENGFLESGLAPLET